MLGRLALCLEGHKDFFMIVHRTLMVFALVLFGGLYDIQAHAWGDPQGFFEKEQVTAVEICPGVVWYSASGTKEEFPLETQVLALDLTASGLTLESVMGARSENPEKGRYFPRSTPSQMLTDNALFAVLNASYFEITATQSPLGIVISGHRLIREPGREQASVLMLADGRVLLGMPQWEGHVEFRGRKIPLDHINHPGFDPGSLALYRPPWRQPPDHNTPFLKGQRVRTLILKQSSGAETQRADGSSFIKAALKAIVEPGATPPLLADDELALVMSAGNAEPWQDLKIGEPVNIFWTLTHLPDAVTPAMVRDAVAAGPMLVQGGRAISRSSSSWATKHPRSAIGVSEDGHRVVLVVVDGRSRQSAGMGHDTLANYLAHLGAEEALNLDGGGSSALVIRRDGKPVVLNHPSDHGKERLVPTAIGVRGRTDGKP